MRALRALAWGSGAIALVLLLTGRFVPPAINNALHEAIFDKILWRPDSPPDVDARFRGLPDPSGEPDYFRVWMWNVTNLADVRKGAKPRMAEVGPLTYIKYRVKVDAWWDRSGRVAVKEWDYHVFQPHLSAARPTDTLTTLNLPLLGTLELLHAYGSVVPSVRTLIDVALGVLSGWRDEHVDGLFVRRTVGELLWGYEDLLLQRLQTLLGRSFVPSTTVRLLPNDTSAEEVIAKQVASVIDTGWRPNPDGRDDAALGLRPDVGSGASGGAGAAGDAGGPLPGGRHVGSGWLPRRRWRCDEASIWNIEAEEGWRQVSSWGGPNCSEPVRGSDAFQFAPGVRRDAPLRVWINELYRSAALLYKEDVELHGVRLLRFEPDPAESQPDVCHRQRIRGMANITAPTAVGPTGNGSSPAAHGVPLLMSLPHYCETDASVAAALEGMSCDPPRHKTFIDVEPNTGITMRAAKRLQLSSEITDSARATLEPGLWAATILPVFWAEEASAISAAQGAAFARSVYGAQRLAAATAKVAYPAAGVSLALAAAATLAAIWRARRSAEAGAAARPRRGAGPDGLGAPLLGTPPAGSSSSEALPHCLPTGDEYGVGPTEPDAKGQGTVGAGAGAAAPARPGLEASVGEDVAGAAGLPGAILVTLPGVPGGVEDEAGGRGAGAGDVG